MRNGLSVFALLLLLCISLHAQSPTAVVNGLVLDTSGGAVPEASVEIINDATRIRYASKTNSDGIYSIPNVPPGTYHIQVSKIGFKTVIQPDIVLNVQDARAINFTLSVGAVSETVTVEGGAPLINTESGAVSTVVDRQFVENLPLNGRSFQTLINLTPGVVLTATSFQDPGQFSVNGQRASANYFMVDGVAANIGVLPGAVLNQTASGSIPGFSVLGGTNNLVSVDALQEFRIQTSTYAPEFGRTPGAQISIATRSGTNQFHGVLFDYLRNDVLDSNDWFSNQKGLLKPKERQNDFGGVVGGPILQDRTFFFFSYEGLRLRLPQTRKTTVPSLSARQSASVAIQPFLNAYPLPNGADLGNGQAEFNASFSDQSTLNATSIRIDHTLSRGLTLFGRYNYAPSNLLPRGFAGLALSSVGRFHFGTQTLTLGTTWTITNAITNDFRFNYSRNRGKSSFRLDGFGGAVPPPDSNLFITPFSSQDSAFAFSVFSLQGGTWRGGKAADNLQRQFNVVDNLSWQKGAHALKFGVDYRRLSPTFGPLAYSQQVAFNDVSSVLADTPSFAFITTNRSGTVLFHNLGAFAQDTWKVTPRLILTYGLHWDVDFAPSTGNGPDLLAVTGVDNPSTLALAPQGTPIFKTRYGNFAPRVGVAYQLSQARGRESVLRGGFGVFYDLATQEVGDALFAGRPPFGASKIVSGNFTFPLDPNLAQPPTISVASLASGQLVSFDPELKLPYTLQWNVALEQSLGTSQTASASYVGSIGRRLIQQENLLRPNPNFLLAQLVRNFASSDYHALQLQFRRRLSHGLQALAFYAWSHSIDAASSSSVAPSNLFVTSLGPNANRGPSDFDIRHTFSAGITYDIPAPRMNLLGHAVLRDWSIDNFIVARSATPVEVFNPRFSTISGSVVDVRPDVVPGIPLYLFGPQYPGGKVLNNNPGQGGPGCKGPFCPPPLDPNTGVPLRQGTLGRNALRGFGATQWDFALRRQFNLHESLRLQFRAEFFNLLNHPNFGNPVGNFLSPLFGQSVSTLAQNLGGGATGGAGGFVPLYQIGGPRSMQFALKLQF